MWNKRGVNVCRRLARRSRLERQRKNVRIVQSEARQSFLETRLHKECMKDRSDVAVGRF